MQRRDKKVLLMNDDFIKTYPKCSAKHPKCFIKKFGTLLPIIMVLLFIIISSLLTPFINNSTMSGSYKFVNMLNSIICHQYPPRCLYIFNNPIGLCARCFAFYTTMFICALLKLFITYDINKKIETPLFVILILPLIIDGTTQYFQIRESTFLIRTITGIMGGMGVSIILIPFYCSIFKHQTIKEK
jgi:uncharacterized membrane protein